MRLVGGAFIVVVGQVSAGLLRIPLLQQLARLDIAHLGTSPRTAFPLGSAFAFGWTSCVGPVLAGVLVTAASTTTMVQAAVLLGS